MMKLARCSLCATEQKPVGYEYSAGGAAIYNWYTRRVSSYRVGPQPIWPEGWVFTGTETLCPRCVDDLERQQQWRRAHP